MFIVMISGKQGSGKSTLSEGLRQYFVSKKTSFVLRKFAYPLYVMHDAVREKAEAFGLEVQGKEGSLLQMLGSWGKERFGKDVWVRVAQKDVSSYEDAHVIVFDDLRFKNEFEAFPEAIKIRLECDREKRKQRCPTWRDNETHESEVDLDDWQHKFDLTLDTGVMDTPSVYKTVVAFLRQRQGLPNVVLP